MGFVKDTFFGGAEKEAAKRESENLIAGGRAQQEAFKLAGETEADFIARGADTLAQSQRQASETEADFAQRAARERADFIGRGSAAQAQAATAGGNLIGQRFGETRAGLQPLISQGNQASQMQAALSGALGPEAQQQAFQNFQESPGTQFLREQGLRQLESGFGARGKLGGGELLRELTRQSQGLALQDLTRQTNQLQQIGGQGFNAQQFVGGLGAQAAGGQASAMQNAGNFTGQGLMNQGSVLGQGLSLEGAARAEGIRGAGQALSSGLASQGSALAGGISGGGKAFGQGVQLSAAAQGQGVLGRNEALKGALQPFGQAAAASPAFQAGMGALTSSIGGAAGAGAAGLSALFSDIRLKTNIVKIGKLKSGLPVYTWDWNHEGEKLTGNKKGSGVIAQEARKHFPGAVGERSGYLTVDYRRIE